ncbi:MAG: hypothetical protein Q7K29_08630 [Thermoleophilia bacterium]|nr:hypothetical protein [Thermoleophilia bacterium]
MKKNLIITAAAITTLIFLAYAAGCGTQGASDSRELSREQYDSIQVGMTTDSLKSMAGEPSKTEAKSMSGGHSMGEGSMTGESMDMQYWYYQGSKGWVRLEVADNKITAKSGY